MAILENIASEIGDVIRIKTEVPVIGLLFIDTFTDSVEGESPTAYFNKEFRYSNDAGLNFTSWQQLSVINIQNVQVDKKDQFILEYRYEVVGDDTDPELRFNSVTVSGEFENLEFPIYNTTLFNKFFDINDINVLNWAINVLEKLYSSGILPQYIKRGDSIDDNTADKDFITYWNTVTHFFALIVYYYREYENIAGEKILLKDFLSNKDLSLPIDDNLQDLSYLLYNYIEEYRKRGTERIAYKNEENGEGVDGEFLRTIGWVNHDEILFALSNNTNVGWCMGLSSPMWDGTERIVNLTKAFEFTEEVKDLTKYPLLNESLISIVTDSDLDKDVMKLDATSGSGDSVGIAVSTPTSVDELINVSESLDYIISFYIKKDQSVNDNLTFRCVGYDEELNQIDTVTLDGTSLNSFIDSSVSEVLPLADQYYYLQGVLFNYDKGNESLGLNFKGGVPLRLQPTTKYISVQILVSDDVGCNFYIYDVKVKPLSLPMTQGLLGTKDIIFSYINNRGEQDNKDMEYFVQRKLIPYNSWFKPKYWEDSGLSPSTKQDVTFIVTDTGDDPINDAKITLYNKDYYTDSSGETTISLYEGDYDYVINKDGYNEYTGSITVSDESLTEEVTLKGGVFENFGYLYNGYAVLEADNEHGGFVPNMNVPTESELNQLKTYLVDNYSNIYDDVEDYEFINNIGAYLKSTREYPDPKPRWDSGNITSGDDMFNFSALPGGECDLYGSMFGLGSEGYWHTKTDDSSDIHWSFTLFLDSEEIKTGNKGLKMGYSVKCVRELTTNEISDFSDGDVVEVINDYDGYEYEVVKIGEQGWTRQNIGTSHYLDGTEIRFAEYGEWQDINNEEIGAYKIYK